MYGEKKSVLKRARKLNADMKKSRCRVASKGPSERSQGGAAAFCVHVKTGRLEMRA